MRLAFLLTSIAFAAIPLWTSAAGVLPNNIPIPTPAPRPASVGMTLESEMTDCKGGKGKCDASTNKHIREVESRVKQIVANHLGVAEAAVTNEASFTDDLCADSLDTVELIMAFEEEFEVEITYDQAQSIRNVGDAVGIITKAR